MKDLLKTAILAVLFVAGQAMADVDPAVANKLEAALKKIQPSLKPGSITESPVKGLYQVIIGSQVVYMTGDARYILMGDFIDLKTKTSISENAKSKLRLKALSKLDEDQMIIYKPKKVDNTITVITDIDCPYCRKLHSEIDDYMKNNVEVRYIFMPLKGKADLKKTISVWCSDDQHTALDIAKAGGQIEAKTCNNPIQEHLKLAHELGVQGTPAIVLEDGELLPGYVPASKLIAQLNSKASKKPVADSASPN
jgi:thiol:disulfide interchange protein DsbC